MTNSLEKNVQKFSLYLIDNKNEVCLRLNNSFYFLFICCHLDVDYFSETAHLGVFCSLLIKQLKPRRGAFVKKFLFHWRYSSYKCSFPHHSLSLFFNFLCLSYVKKTNTACHATEKLQSTDTPYRMHVLGVRYYRNNNERVNIWRGFLSGLLLQEITQHLPTNPRALMQVGLD